jgi:hypothetical protein
MNHSHLGFLVPFAGTAKFPLFMFNEIIQFLEGTLPQVMLQFRYHQVKNWRRQESFEFVTSAYSQSDFQKT